MSDLLLQSYARLAKADPENNNLVWKYAAQLERHVDAIPLTVQDPLTQHLEVALATNGVISSLKELPALTKFSQLEKIAKAFFPFNGTLSAGEMHDITRLVVHIGSTFHPKLSTFFTGCGRFTTITDVWVWVTPFKLDIAIRQFGCPVADRPIEYCPD